MGMVWAVRNLRVLATLLPQMRTSGHAPIKSFRHDFVGFSTTSPLLANKAQHLHSPLRLMKRESFAQNAAVAKIAAMDF
jgi:hypothetical protein